MKNCIKIIFFLFVTLHAQHEQEKNNMNKKVLKTDAEWATCLTPQEYKILREKGTEMAFTGKYYNHKEDGTYTCAGCDYELFSSETKFDSGTGWPSFDRGNEENLEYDVDYKIGYARSELKCNKCGGHLGHMFSDGPKATTGKRHCINSAALNFIASDE